MVKSIMLAIVHACAIVGIEGRIVDVEVDFNPRAGIPYFTIVGLPDAAVRESRERIRSAIKNSNHHMRQRRHGESTQGTLGQTGDSEDQKLYGKEQQQSGLQFVN